jgi:hypothetical protein
MQNSKKLQPQQRVDDGFYNAQLIDQRFTKNGMGTRIHWVFELKNKELRRPDGSYPTLIRTTSPSMNEGAKRREIAEALNPKLKDLFGATPLEEVRGISLIGKTCKVHVVNSPNKNGVVYSNLEAFFPCYHKQQQQLDIAEMLAPISVMDKKLAAKNAANEPEDNGLGF